MSAASAQPDDDEDDLFAIVRAQPMDLSSEKVDEIMRDLPADWVDDRDQWLTVGAALHHPRPRGA
ncbi:MAG: hypothetical protein E5V77_00220 [Mesorhizobium sp.]|nr:MAG: hypothetical protein E5V77_00220 [Mesorhizobium sp.]